MKQKQIKLKEKIDSRTITAEDFNTPLSTMENNLDRRKDFTTPETNLMEHFTQIHIFSSA